MNGYIDDCDGIAVIQVIKGQMEMAGILKKTNFLFLHV
jgi:hypothetical protein